MPGWLQSHNNMKNIHEIKKGVKEAEKVFKENNLKM